MGVGDHYTLPEDTSYLFLQSKAPENSNILVISADISSTEFSLSNICFCFEGSQRIAPLQSITTIDEFRAAMKLSKNAKLCPGVEIIPKADNTVPNFRHAKVVRNGRLFSSVCNVLAYPNKGNVCVNCKSIRCNNRSSASNSPSLPDVVEVTDSTKYG